MKILFAFDGSDSSRLALNDLSSAGLPAEGQIAVISVMENWLPPPSSLEALREISREMEVQGVAENAGVMLKSQFPGWEVNAEFGVGAPATAVLDFADRFKPDLIVVGSHGRSAIGRFFLGSVSQRLLLDAPCSVRIARGPEPVSGKPLRIMAGIDGSANADAAVAELASRNWPAGTEIRLVNANSPIPVARTEEPLDKLAKWIDKENRRMRAKVEAAIHCLEGRGLKVSAFAGALDPVKLLLREAERWKADCIFLGARGAGTIERLVIGSVSAAVAARAHCSVEVVRTASW